MFTKLCVAQRQAFECAEYKHFDHDGRLPQESRSCAQGLDGLADLNSPNHLQFANQACQDHNPKICLINKDRIVLPEKLCKKTLSKEKAPKQTKPE